MKWGIKRMPGINKKAGKVMRLKRPKTATTPSTVEDRMEDRCYVCVSLVFLRSLGNMTNLRIHYTLDQDQTPGDNERLDRVGKGMCLVRPSNVGRGDKEDSNPPMSWRRDELVERPVLEDEAGEEHENPERPEDGNGRNLAILAVTDPEPSQQQHGQAVDRP